MRRNFSHGEAGQYVDRNLAFFFRAIQSRDVQLRQDRLPFAGFRFRPSLAAAHLAAQKGRPLRRLRGLGREQSLDLTVTRDLARDLGARGFRKFRAQHHVVPQVIDAQD